MKWPSIAYSRGIPLLVVIKLDYNSIMIKVRKDLYRDRVIEWPYKVPTTLLVLDSL